MDAIAAAERPSSSLATIFKVSLYLLVCLASLALALGEESAFPTGLTIPLAIAAFFLNEQLGVLRLSPGWSSLFGAVAFVVTAIAFIPAELLSRLLSGAHLLVYLTWIVLFQDKTKGRAISLYWLMLALSLLQVAIGSVLTLSGWFGVVLLPWMLLALWTISTFSLYQGELRFAGQAQHGIALSDVRGRSMLRNSVQLDPTERWLSFRFVFGIGSISLVGLLLGMVFFLFVPRLWVGGLNVFARDGGSPVGGRALTGFGDSVRLGDIGQILENRQPVMRVSLVSSDATRQLNLEGWVRDMTPPDLPAPVLFRGTVFDRYQRDLNGQGSWTREAKGGNFDLVSVSTVPAGRKYVKQLITLEPIASDVAFAVWPMTAARIVDGGGPLLHNRSNVLFFREPPRAATSYIIFSPASPEAKISDKYWRRYLHMPDGLPRLKQLASDLSREESLPQGPDSLERRRALALDAYLRTSGIYGYTLTDSIVDRSIDPVEDFLFNRKAGHCQYFASALTLMLRSVNIPARLVNGFKGVEPSGTPGEYIVEQRHAHAWVEAWVDGRWLTLDPTGEARDVSVEEIGHNVSSWSSLQNELSSIWSSYVVGLSIERQQRSFFEPIASVTTSAVKLVTGGDGQMSMPHWLYLLFTSPELWFTRDGVATALTMLAFVWGGYFVCSRLMRELLRVVRGTRRGARPTVRVDFYERFLKLTARRGVVRAEGQTAREFCQGAGRVLFELLQPAGLQAFPAQLADQFYRVRFGGETLPPEETLALNGQLDRFEQCVRGKHQLHTGKSAESDRAAVISGT